jgi:hypothetical protein
MGLEKAKTGMIGAYSCQQKCLCYNLHHQLEMHPNGQRPFGIESDKAVNGVS